MSDNRTRVHCRTCDTDVLRDAVKSNVKGVDWPVYHLLPGSPPEKCPGSDKPAGDREQP